MSSMKTNSTIAMNVANPLKSEESVTRTKAFIKLKQKPTVKDLVWFLSDENISVQPRNITRGTIDGIKNCLLRF
uniref:Uncharacterized protein n=1 Tax=Lepeophtheirus salmonis TaxID=72036 RepID=A0A0K2TQ28_LEPSM